MTKRWRETEFELAKFLQRNGWPHAEAVGSGASGTDIKGTPGVPWEAKTRKDFSPMAALRQNLAREGDFHPVVMRPNGMGPAKIDQWPAFLPLGELVRLLRLAGYGDPLEEAQGVAGDDSDSPGDRLTLDEWVERIRGLVGANRKPSDDAREVSPVPEGG